MSDKKMDYEALLTIDRDALDEEWLDQPRRFFAIARAEAEQRRRVDEQKEATELIKAQVDRKVRSEPQSFGLEGRITEGAIAGVLQQDPDCQRAVQDSIDARFELDVLVAATRSMMQRKDALENLVRLHGQDYFSSPSLRKAGESVGAVQVGAALGERAKAAGKAAVRSRARDSLGKRG